VAGLNLLEERVTCCTKPSVRKSLRFQVRAHNYANANTPAYKRQDVDFAAHLTSGAGEKG